MDHDAVSRRDFLARAGTAAVSVAAASRIGTREAEAQEKTSPNERVGVGVMGLRNQGRLDGLEFLNSGLAEIVAVCDVDDAQIERVAADFTNHENQPREPKKVKDFRRMLDDPDIDAIIIATPDHWHAQATVMACQAGRDVYIEKPLSWSIAEGRAMVSAARENDRVVQVGTQQRSGAHFFEGLDLIKSGKLGDVNLARGWIAHVRPDIGTPPDGPVPEGVDYDMWLGPAPNSPFNPNRFHYNWHFFWDYGTGEMGNWGAHWLDVIRWGLDLDVPSSSCASGGIYHPIDAKETPDTQMVVYDFPGLTVVWEQWLWSKRKIEGHACAAAFYGTEGTLVIGRGGWKLYGPDGGSVLEESGGSPLESAHVTNFLQCVKSRKRPTADVEEGHKSAIMCHMANVSIQTGRKLHFDAKTETFIDDDEANTLLMREYREPWGIQG
jgi:predicted dehydrogenase